MPLLCPNKIKALCVVINQSLTSSLTYANSSAAQDNIDVALSINDNYFQVNNFLGWLTFLST